jgi:hypothetical protein
MIPLTKLTLAALGAAVFTAQPSRAQFDLIGVCWDASNSSVVRVNPATGYGTTLGVSGVPGLNSLAQNSAGTLFSASGNQLVTLDPNTGIATRIATLDFGTELASVRGLAFSSADVLFAINDAPRAAPDNLYTISPDTGSTTLVGNTGLPGIQAIAFSPQGVLYGWDVGSYPVAAIGLVTIDTITGLATDVDPLVDAPYAVQSIEFAPDGTLYGACDALHRIDVASGATTLVGSGGYLDIRGLAVVPEPSAFSLLLFGLCLSLLTYGGRQKRYVTTP